MLENGSIERIRVKMKTKVELQYNDLKMFLTKEDLQQIKDMPEPSLEQAQKMKHDWQTYFGTDVVPRDNPENIVQGIIWIKPYMKAFDTYPEIFI